MKPKSSNTKLPAKSPVERVVNMKPMPELSKAEKWSKIPDHLLALLSHVL